MLATTGPRTQDPARRTRDARRRRQEAGGRRQFRPSNVERRTLESSSQTATVLPINYCDGLCAPGPPLAPSFPRSLAPSRPFSAIHHSQLTIRHPPDLPANLYTVPHPHSDCCPLAPISHIPYPIFPRPALLAPRIPVFESSASPRHRAVRPWPASRIPQPVSFARPPISAMG